MREPKDEAGRIGRNPEAPAEAAPEGEKPADETGTRRGSKSEEEPKPGRGLKPEGDAKPDDEAVR